MNYWAYLEHGRMKSVKLFSGLNCRDEQASKLTELAPPLLSTCPIVSMARSRFGLDGAQPPESYPFRYRTRSSRIESKSLRNRRPLVESVPIMKPVSNS